MENNFKINNIFIKSVYHGSMAGDYENVFRQKILSTLSVVQVLEGDYEISLDGSPFISTGEGGVFIAPKNAVQKIIHHNGKNGKMVAQWVFVDAIVNEHFAFDDLFSLPTVLDSSLNKLVDQLIQTIRFTDNCFEKTNATNSLLKILFENSVLKKKDTQLKAKIADFVEQNYAKNISATDIAKTLFCSTAQVFKYTKKFFNLSPANYVNGVRLGKAEKLLLFSNDSVTDVAINVGFDDSSYFSKLFKRHYGISPLNYRKDFAIKKETI